MGEQDFNSEEEEKAFNNSRPGFIVLIVLAVMQLGFVVTGAPVNLAPATETTDGVLLLVINFVLGCAAVALICAFFAWQKRSRIAMGIGLLLVGINWLGISMSMADGFNLNGVAVNFIATIFLISSLLAAFQYHRLRKQAAGEVDPEVFS